MRRADFNTYTDSKKKVKSNMMKNINSLIMDDDLTDDESVGSD